MNAMPLIPYAIGQWAGYKPAPHHRLIASHLQRVSRGECQRLMVFMPPRHGKSMLASEYFPAWWLAQHPDQYVIASTYAQELADDFGRKVRNLWTTDAHRAMFPDAILRDDSQAANRFHTTEGGAYFAVGAGGAITGRGAHLLLIDDPIKGREEAESETMRRRLRDWYTSVARTRLMPGGSIIVIQTRWHEDDLAGWLLREHQHEGWTVLSLPALAEPNDAIGRDEGQPLWPECYPVEELQRIRLSVGSRDWLALYQQRPSAAEGSVFRREHWRYHTPMEDEPKAICNALGVHRVIQAWDTAFKTRDSNDWSVCVTLGVTSSRYYVLDVWRGRVEFPDLRRALVSQAQRWGAHAVVVEDAAAGQSLLQELRRGTLLPLIARKADRDKLARAHAVTPLHEAGVCYLPEGAAWLGDFVDEMSSFPSAPHDDQVDAFVHAMTYAREVAGAVVMDEQSAHDPEDELIGGASNPSWMGA